MAQPFKIESTTEYSDVIKVKIEMNEVSQLVGRILEVFESVFPIGTSNYDQGQSIKNLLKHTIWDWANQWHLAVTKEKLEELAKNAEECEPPEEDQVDHLPEE